MPAINPPTNPGTNPAARHAISDEASEHRRKKFKCFRANSIYVLDEYGGKEKDQVSVGIEQFELKSVGD